MVTVLLFLKWPSFVHVLMLISACSDGMSTHVCRCNRRYDPATDVLRLVGNRLPTAETNREYLKQLLARLVVESKRVAAEVAK